MMLVSVLEQLSKQLIDKCDIYVRMSDSEKLSNLQLLITENKHKTDVTGKNINNV